MISIHIKNICSICKACPCVCKRLVVEMNAAFELSRVSGMTATEAVEIIRKVNAGITHG